MSKKPTFKAKNSIGSSGNMVGGPLKKGQTPMKESNKKPEMGKMANKMEIMIMGKRDKKKGIGKKGGKC